MGDHVFLKVMPKIGVIRFSKRDKLSLRYIRPFQDTREGGHGCILVGPTTKFVKCARGIPYLHALEVHAGSDSWWIGESLWLMRMRPSMRDQYVSWTTGNRFYAVRL